MHDLNTINRLNAEAAQKHLDAVDWRQAIANFQRQGRYVLAKYAGLTLVSVETFDNAAEAQAAHEASNLKTDSSHSTLFLPLTVAPAAQTLADVISESQAADQLEFNFPKEA